MNSPSASLPPFMLVDDDENHVLLLARRLKDAGVKNTLLHLRNGGEAFMYLKQFCDSADTGRPLPSLMFLDVNMPGLSGFDVLAWVRQQPALGTIKVIMLSGANEEWDAQIATKLGADDYVLKFPAPAALSELIASVLAVAPH